MPDLPGMYANTPGWHSQQRWLSAVDRWATSRTGRRDCHRKISHDTLLRIAAALAAYADHDTGRRCAPSQTTIATDTGCTRETVKRAEHILTTAGLLTLIHGGGNYTHAMHRQYHRLRKAGHQLIKPNHCTRIRALTLPHPHTKPGHNVPLPTAGRSPLTSQACAWTPNARIRAREAAPRPKKPQQRKEERGLPPIALQRLAAALVARLPWLTRTHHIGAICDALNSAGIEPHRWGTNPHTAATTLITHLAQPAPIPTGNTCHNPIGWLHHALQQVDPQRPTSAEHHRAQRAQLQAEQDQHRRDAAANRAAAIPLNQSTAANEIRQTLANISRRARPHNLPPTPEPSPRAWGGR